MGSERSEMNKMKSARNLTRLHKPLLNKTNFNIKSDHYCILTCVVSSCVKWECEPNPHHGVVMRTE